MIFLPMLLSAHAGCLFTPEAKVAVAGQEVEGLGLGYDDEKVDCKQRCHDWCACPGEENGDKIWII